MWKFVTGAKEPLAKKSKKDCEYELHRKLRKWPDCIFFASFNPELLGAL
jgi:hypothetical protein